MGDHWLLHVDDPRIKRGQDVNIGINTLFYIPGQVGGSETYLLEILRAWQRAQPPHTFTLFTQRENHEPLSTEFAGPGWRFVFCPFRAERRVTRILREQTELPWKARKNGVDVLWSPGYTSPIFTRLPRVVSLLDMQYKRFPDDLSPLARVTTHLLVQAIARTPARILTISEFSKSEILRFTPVGEDRVHVTLLAADPAFDPRPNPPPNPPYLLCVANSYPHKAVDWLVRAFGRLEPEIPHDLVIVGRERLGEPSVRAAVHTLRDPRRIRRLSGLTRRELADLYTGADVFVFPSRYEGFGLPVLEAMRAGVPVVTTRAGSIPEVSGDTAWYVKGEKDEDLADTLRRALSENPAEREARVTAGRKRAEGFSWEQTAARTLKNLVENL